MSIKFRPSLTSNQISYLIGVLQSQPACQDQQEILASLHKFHLKAVHGIVSPSHVAVGKPTLESSLGFSPDPIEESIESLLQVFKTNPKILSPTQLDKVQHHRYVNDMMTPEEERSYEQGD